MSEKETEKDVDKQYEEEVNRIQRDEKTRKYAKYLSRKLYGVRFFNGKEIRKVFKYEILPLLQKEDVNYSLYFVTGEEGLMELISQGIQNGFSFIRWGEGQKYDILPELVRLINHRYEGYKYYLKHYDDYSSEDLEHIDERNYATGIDEIEIWVYKSHLDQSVTYKDITVRFIDYLDYNTLQ